MARSKIVFMNLCDQLAIQYWADFASTWRASRNRRLIAANHFQLFTKDSMTGFNKFNRKKDYVLPHHLKEDRRMESTQHFAHGQVPIWRSTWKLKVSGWAMASLRILGPGLMLAYITMWVDALNLNYLHWIEHMIVLNLQCISSHF